MKKCFRILAMILVLASLLTIGAAAAYTPGEGLAVFEDVADMTTYTFSDLSSNHWAYSGIEVSYNKGVLYGYQDGTFRAEKNVTWGQAIVIAARIHAAYFGNALDLSIRSGDEWYSPYYRYCDAHNMIPSSCPKGVYLDGIVINRYDLAYIFSRTIDKADLPAISDLAITDIDQIPQQYLSSVKFLYSAGVLNGWANNNFGGERLTTRAQMAMIISRLLLPSERTGVDSRANADMADFQSNLENDSVAVQIGSNYYCLYRSYENETDLSYSLYLTDGKDLTRALYTAKPGQYLNNISLYNGKVYFCCGSTGSAEGSLLRYDPASGKVSTVYSGYIVESYCFYDGGIYALAYTNYADDVSGYRYAFGKIVNGGFNAFISDLEYSRVANFTPYGWNGKIYFKLSETMPVSGSETNEISVDKLYAYDISRNELEKVADYNINASFFDGHVMYFLAYDNDGNYDLNLYAISIQAPAVVKTIGQFPNTTNVRYRSLYKNGDLFYCLSSFNRNLYSMTGTGATRLALMCGGVYDSINFTDDKLILIPNTLTTSNPNELKVYNASSLSSRALYGDWIGLSVYYEGARFVPEDGKSAFVSDESVSTVSGLNITVPKAFSRGDDFIVQAKYRNDFSTGIKLRSYIVKVYLDNELVAYDFNRMVGMEMKSGDIQTYTFVIAGADVLRGFDVSDGRISVEIVPTYDIIPEEVQ